MAQTTLDPKQMKEWTPNSRYGGHAFGFMPDPKDTKTRDTQFARFLAAREEVLPWIKEYSPIEHVSADDPPIYLIYSDPPAMGQDQKDPTHTANFGVKLQEKLRSVGVECELVYPGAPDVKHPQVHDYLIEKLQGAAPAAESGLPNPFFVFSNGLDGVQDPPKVLKDLGYAGVGVAGLNVIPAVKQYEKAGLKVFNTYVGCRLDKTPAYDPQLKKAIQELKGTGVAPLADGARRQVRAGE